MENNKPLVSIIINCFNGSKFIEKALLSALNQNYTNLEIIVWDNQSTDNSKEIIKKYNDKRIKYFYAPEHTLLYQARNLAIEQSKGELLAFLDCDDWWKEDKISKQVRKFQSDEYAVVYSNMRLVFDKETRFGKRINKLVCKLLSRDYIRNNYAQKEGFILNEILNKYIVGLPSIMINRKYFSGFNERYHIIGDMDFVVKTAAKYKFGYINECLAFYRVHGSNESFKKRKLQIEEWKIWLREVENDTTISKLNSFKKLKYKVLYLEAMDYIADRNFKAAIASINKVPLKLWKLKIRMIIILVSPQIVVKIFRT